MSGAARFIGQKVKERRGIVDPPAAAPAASALEAARQRNLQLLGGGPPQKVFTAPDAALKNTLGST